MKGARKVVILTSLLLPWPAQATLMKAGSVQIFRSLVASAGRPLAPEGRFTLAHIIAPPAGSYMPPSLFFAHAIRNDIYMQGGRIRITISENSVPSDFFLRASKDSIFSIPGLSPDDIQIANQKSAAQGESYRQPIPNGIIEILAYGADGHQLKENLGKPVSLSVAVDNVVEGGVVAGTDPKIRVHTLSLWILDPDRKMWRNLPDSSIDNSGKRVNAKFQRFGVYAIMGSADPSLNQVITYPVPWRPHSGNPLTGNEADGITFDLLPSECTIRIFTISGELVKEIKHSGGDSIEKWDVRTPGGESVASGLYVYTIKTSSGHRVGKLIVIR